MAGLLSRYLHLDITIMEQDRHVRNGPTVGRAPAKAAALAHP
jgi:hypothetical protein